MNYDQLIEDEAREQGVDPRLLKSVFHAESGGNPDIHDSPQGAQGGMQLMPDTAKAMGVKNPRDIKEALRGGAKYLRQGLDATGSAEGALSYYHGGPNRNIWGPKTAAYVAKVQNLYPTMQLTGNAMSSIDDEADKILERYKTKQPAPASDDPHAEEAEKILQQYRRPQGTATTPPVEPVVPPPVAAPQPTTPATTVPPPEVPVTPPANALTTPPAVPSNALTGGAGIPTIQVSPQPQLPNPVGTTEGGGISVQPVPPGFTGGSNVPVNLPQMPAPPERPPNALEKPKTDMTGFRKPPPEEVKAKTISTLDAALAGSGKALADLNEMAMTPFRWVNDKVPFLKEMDEKILGKDASGKPAIQLMKTREQVEQADKDYKFKYGDSLVADTAHTATMVAAILPVAMRAGILGSALTMRAASSVTTPLLQKGITAAGNMLTSAGVSAGAAKLTGDDVGTSALLGAITPPIGGAALKFFKAFQAGGMANSMIASYGARAMSGMLPFYMTHSMTGDMAYAFAAAAAGVSVEAIAERYGMKAAAWAYKAVSYVNRPDIRTGISGAINPHIAGAVNDTYNYLNRPPEK